MRLLLLLTVLAAGIGSPVPVLADILKIDFTGSVTQGSLPTGTPITGTILIDRALAPAPVADLFGNGISTQLLSDTPIDWIRVSVNFDTALLPAATPPIPTNTDPIPPPPNETLDTPPQATGQGVSFLFSQPRNLCCDSVIVTDLTGETIFTSTGNIAYITSVNLILSSLTPFLPAAGVPNSFSMTGGNSTGSFSHSRPALDLDFSFRFSLDSATAETLVVPEPNTAVLLTCAALALLLTTRCRRFASLPVLFLIAIAPAHADTLKIDFTGTSTEGVIETVPASPDPLNYNTQIRVSLFSGANFLAGPGLPTGFSVTTGSGTGRFVHSSENASRTNSDVPAPATTALALAALTGLIAAHTRRRLLPLPLLLLTTLAPAHAGLLQINFNGQVTGGTITATDANGNDTITPIAPGSLTGFLTLDTGNAPAPTVQTFGNNLSTSFNSPTPQDWSRVGVSFVLPTTEFDPVNSDPASFPGMNQVGETNTRIVTFNYSQDRTTCCDTITTFHGTAQLFQSPSLQISHTFGAGLIFSTTTGDPFFLPGPGLPNTFSLSSGNAPSFVSIDRTYTFADNTTTRLSLRANFVITGATAETSIPEPSTAALLLLGLCGIAAVRSRSATR